MEPDDETRRSPYDGNKSCNLCDMYFLMEIIIKIGIK